MDKSPSTSRRLLHFYVPVFTGTALLVYFAPAFLANEHTEQICRVCTHAWGFASLSVLLFLLVFELRSKAEATDTTDDF